MSNGKKSYGQISLMAVVILFFVPNSAFANGIGFDFSDPTYLVLAGFIFVFLIAYGFVLRLIFRKIFKKILGKEKFERKSRAINIITSVFAGLMVAPLLAYVFDWMFIYM